MSMKNSNDTIGNRTRDLPACSAVPQPTAPLGAPINVSKHVKSPKIITNDPKSVPLQAWSGPEGFRKLMFPDFMTTVQEGGKVVSLTHRPHLPPVNPPGTHFCFF